MSKQIFQLYFTNCESLTNTQLTNLQNQQPAQNHNQPQQIIQPQPNQLQQPNYPAPQYSHFKTYNKTHLPDTFTSCNRSLIAPVKAPSLP